MLPRKHRVPKELFKTAGPSRTTSLSFASVKILDGQDSARISFVVSKKVAKTAVARNTMRRRGSSLVERAIPLFIKQVALIFYLKSNFKEKTDAEIKTELKSFFEKNNILPR